MVALLAPGKSLVAGELEVGGGLQVLGGASEAAHSVSAGCFSGHKLLHVALNMTDLFEHRERLAVLEVKVTEVQRDITALHLLHERELAEIRELKEYVAAAKGARWALAGLVAAVSWALGVVSAGAGLFKGSN